MVPELPEKQKEALHKAVRAVMMTTNVACRRALRRRPHHRRRDERHTGRCAGGVQEGVETRVSASPISGTLEARRASPTLTRRRYYWLLESYGTPASFLRDINPTMDVHESSVTRGRWI